MSESDAEVTARLRREHGADTPHARYLDERLTAAMTENQELRADNKRIREHLAGSCKAGAALRGLWDAIGGLADEWQRQADSGPVITIHGGGELYSEVCQLRRVHAAELRALLDGQEPPAGPVSVPDEGPEAAVALARWLAVSGSPEALAAVHVLRTLLKTAPFTANQAADEVRAILRDGSIAEALATHREALGMESPAEAPGSPAPGREGASGESETAGTLGGAQEAVSAPDGGGRG